MSSALPCGIPFGDVDDDDVGELLDGDAARHGRADVAGAAHDGDFPVHDVPRSSARLPRSHAARCLHVLDDRVGELRRLQLGRALHQAREVVGDASSARCVFSSAGSMRSAASFQPRCANIITPDRITEPGLTLSWSAYLGAVPWVASKMLPVSSSMLAAGRDADAADLRGAARPTGSRRSGSAWRSRRTRPAGSGPAGTRVGDAVLDQDLALARRLRRTSSSVTMLVRGTPPWPPRSPSRGTPPR